MQNELSWTTYAAVLTGQTAVREGEAQYINPHY